MEITDISVITPVSHRQKIRFFLHLSNWLKQKTFFFSSFRTRVLSVFHKKNNEDVETDSRNFPPKFPRKRIAKILKGIGVIVIASVIIIAGFKFFTSRPSKAEVAGQKTEIAQAKKSQDLDVSFYIPIKDNKGKEIGKLQYAIQKAEIRDQIVHNGQVGKAVQGRTFLVVMIKITNEMNQSIQVNTKDYLRLSINGKQEEWLAPDFHNDPVEVQAISTKYGNLGFAINESDKNLVLRYGEIDGEKHTVELNLQ